MNKEDTVWRLIENGDLEVALDLCEEMGWHVPLAIIVPRQRSLPWPESRAGHLSYTSSSGWGRLGRSGWWSRIGRNQLACEPESWLDWCGSWSRGNEDNQQAYTST